jgi:predicted lipid carrier protein YhbT
MFKSLWEQELTCNRYTESQIIWKQKYFKHLLEHDMQRPDSQIVYDLTFRFWICSDSVAFFLFKYLTDKAKLQCNLAAVVVVIVW